MTFRLQRTHASAACVNRSHMCEKRKKIKEFVTIATNSRVFGDFLAGSGIKREKSAGLCVLRPCCSLAASHVPQL